MDTQVRRLVLPEEGPGPYVEKYHHRTDDLYVPIVSPAYPVPLGVAAWYVPRKYHVFGGKLLTRQMTKEPETCGEHKQTICQGCGARLEYFVPADYAIDKDLHCLCGRVTAVRDVGWRADTRAGQWAMSWPDYLSISFNGPSPYPIPWREAEHYQCLRCGGTVVVHRVWEKNVVAWTIHESCECRTPEENKQFLRAKQRRVKVYLAAAVRRLRAAGDLRLAADMLDDGAEYAQENLKRAANFRGFPIPPPGGPPEKE